MRTFLFLILALPFIWIGCDSNNVPPNSSEYVVTATRDGRGWHGQASAFTREGPLGRQLGVLGTFGDIQNPCPPPFFCQQLLFDVTLTADPIGRYELGPSAPGSPIASFFFVDGDAIISEYKALSGAGDYLQIEEFDEAAQIVAGTFEAVLVNEHAPFDTLGFTDGRFRAQYQMN